MYLFYVPGRGFNSPHLQNAFCNFNKTGIEPREASAEQVRGRGGTDAAGSERRRLERAYRMYATESGSIPPISMFEGIIGSVILGGIRKYRIVKNTQTPVYTECIQNIRQIFYAFTFNFVSPDFTPLSIFSVLIFAAIHLYQYIAQRLSFYKINGILKP